jgi:hydrogenase nickel incorporation protein HypA/HybF
MHELVLAEDIFKKAMEKAGNAKKVKMVRVLLGETRFTDKEELVECFNLITSDGPFEGVKLEIEVSPLKAKCGHCGKEINEKTLRLDCPNCGSTNIEIVSGQELKILEVDCAY